MHTHIDIPVLHDPGTVIMNGSAKGLEPD